MTAGRILVLVLVGVLLAVCLLLLELSTRALDSDETTEVVAARGVPSTITTTSTTTTTIATTTTARARTAPIVRAASVSRPVPVGDGSVWDRLAACESGGRWNLNTGNGYYGGLQMDMQFWRSYGGPAYASRADLASREQQIVVAERARDSGRGYRPWPTCAARLGLI